MATLLVRGFNPIWSEVDLTGHQFDDTFYLFVLQNQIPYNPATVWHDISRNFQWTQPIQFLANGTLPVDIYWDPDVVYRLEFRQGNTQQDPLIYLVENYSPESGGSTPPIVTTGVSLDNQVTNPQFALVSFNSPLTKSSINNPDFEFAPGWFLHAGGTGNVTITQLLLNSADPNPSNASYAVEIQLSGSFSDTPYIYQRFQQNGLLWSGKLVSCDVTARVTAGSNQIFAQIYDSQNNLLAQVLNPVAVDSTYNEFSGSAVMATSTDTDFPPGSYIEFRLFLEATIDITITSIQLVVNDKALAVEPAFQQTTIERQTDQTFHYYRNSILFMPKSSYLTGWDFGLNPWQFTPTAPTQQGTIGYTADQTIVVQQRYILGLSGNNISTARASPAQNYGFKVTAVTATNQFAIIQYISPNTIRTAWGNIVSSMVHLSTLKKNPGANLRMKMVLLCKAGLPATIDNTDPIAAWTAGQAPTFAAAWTIIPTVSPENDPVYNLSNGANTLTFDNMQLPVSTNDNMTLAVVLYLLDAMDASGTPDNIVFNSVSLVPNRFAIDTNVLTYDEVLSQSQYYYSKSFGPGVVPATQLTNGQMIFPQPITGSIKNTTSQMFAFPNEMQVIPGFILPNVIFYNTEVANAQIRNISTSPHTDCSLSQPDVISNYGFVATYNGSNTSVAGDYLTFQWSADARLGV